jgi:uncharacterized membrane protein YhaH (DUF805 family)
MSVLHYVLVFLPFATATLITFILAWLVCGKKLDIAGKRIFRLLLYYVPVIIFAVVFTCAVPNGAEAGILTVKIISYFLPIIWFIILIVFLSLVTNGNDEKESNPEH